MTEDQAVTAIVQFIRAHYNRDMSEQAIATETGLTVDQVRQIFAFKMQAVSAGYYRVATGVRKATILDQYWPPDAS